MREPHTTPPRGSNAVIDLAAAQHAAAVARARLPPPERGILLIGPEYQARIERRYTTATIHEMRRSGPHFRWGHVVIWLAARRTGKAIGGTTTGVALARECVEAALDELERTRPRNDIRRLAGA